MTIRKLEETTGKIKEKLTHGEIIPVLGGIFDKGIRQSD